MPHNSTHVVSSNVGLGRFDTSGSGSPTKEEIAQINAGNTKVANKYGIKIPSKKPKVESITMGYDEIAEKSGVGLATLDTHVANNPAYDPSQRNAIALGNAANMTEAFNLQVPDIKASGNFDKYMENVTLQRYAGVLDANSPNTRNALDITNKAIEEYQSDPDNFFNKNVQTNIDVSYKNSKRNGFSNLLGVIDLVQRGGALNKSQFDDLTTKSSFDNSVNYGGVSAYESADVEGITHNNPNLTNRGITGFTDVTEGKGVDYESMLIKRGKTAEKAMKLGAAQIANAEYNTIMNTYFGGTKLINNGTGLPDINRTKEYIANTTENMNGDQRRKFRSDFLRLAVEGFQAPYTGKSNRSIPMENSSDGMSIKKMAIKMFGESVARQVLKDYND